MDQLVQASSANISSIQVPPWWLAWSIALFKLGTKRGPDKKATALDTIIISHNKKQHLWTCLPLTVKFFEFSGIGRNDRPSPSWRWTPETGGYFLISESSTCRKSLESHRALGVILNPRLCAVFRDGRTIFFPTFLPKAAWLRIRFLAAWLIEWLLLSMNSNGISSQDTASIIGW